MLLLDFGRYLRGYVRFTAKGPFVERFLNLAAKNRIPIWDGRKSGDTYTGCVDIKGYKQLRRHAKKARVQMRIVEKQGVPFKRYKYRHRHGLAAGAALFALFVFIMSLFIWRIEVGGNDTVPETKILQVLDSLSIRPGILRGSIDVRASENRALLLLHELSWIAINIEGSTIHVEVKESVATPEIIDPKKPCNIVAGADGQILALHTYDGQALVQVGDTVMKGDVIVSGVTQDRLGQNRFRHAQAQAIARTDYRIEIPVPLSQTSYTETGKVRRRNFLDIMGFDLPLFLPFPIPQPYYVQREENPVTLFSLGTPLTLLKEDYILMEGTPILLTEEEAQKQALAELAQAEELQLSKAEVHSRSLTAAVLDGVYILRADYQVSMDIAVENEILLDHSKA